MPNIGYKTMLFPVLFSIVVYLMLCSPAISVYLPYLRFSPWSKASALAVISKFRTLDFNHDFVGNISQIDDKPPVGFVLRSTEVVIGKTVEDFHKANKILSGFKMANKLPWIKIITENDNNINIGDNLATMAKCYGIIWALNPCRFIQKTIDAPFNMRMKHRDGKIQRYSEIAYSTLQGHLIAGEERFRVYLNKDKTGENSVTFEICSFSRGSGFLGSIAFPLIKPLQNAFFQDVPKAMIEEMNKPGVW
jgi:uncharacterized protein (UPF0548 family)